MLNCVAAIQFDKERQKFVMVSGNNRVEIRKTKALKKFVDDAPEISADILTGLSDVWFPEEPKDGIEEAEFEEVKEDDKILRRVAAELLRCAATTGPSGPPDKDVLTWVESNFPDLASHFDYFYRQEQTQNAT